MKPFLLWAWLILRLPITFGGVMLLVTLAPDGVQLALVVGLLVAGVASVVLARLA